MIRSYRRTKIRIASTGLLLLAAFFLVHGYRGPGSAYADRLAELTPEQQAEMAVVYAYLDFGGDLSFLTPEEQEHMADVRALFAALKTLFLLSLLRTLHFVRAKRLDRRALERAGLATMGVAFLLGAAALSFQRFWTLFHVVLFPQGNWAFPADSVLITLFPEAYFATVTVHVLAAAALLGLAAYATRALARSGGRPGRAHELS